MCYYVSWANGYVANTVNYTINMLAHSLLQQLQYAGQRFSVYVHTLSRFILHPKKSGYFKSFSYRLVFIPLIDSFLPVVLSSLTYKTDLNAGEILQMFGKMFFVFCQESGYDTILRVLGSNVREFLQVRSWRSWEWRLSVSAPKVELLSTPT